VVCASSSCSYVDDIVKEELFDVIADGVLRDIAQQNEIIHCVLLRAKTATASLASHDGIATGPRALGRNEKTRKKGKKKTS
jgi:hypothetical protein